MGYAGGRTENPTYYKLGDHTEAFEIDYDPQKITYEQLLDIFWQSHNPCSRAGSRQYMSAVFYHNEEQKKLTIESRDREQARRKSKIVTEILPLTKFYLAEDYHQKYMLRESRELMKEFKVFYPDEKEFVNSTAAARINGYLGGRGRGSDLAREIGSFGLTASGRKALLSAVRGGEE